MATTENNYTGSTATTYSFTFPYLKSTDVKVSKNGTVLALGSGATEYTQATTSITLGAAPLAADKIRIYRETGDSDLTATFYPGSAIKSSDLNDNFTQNLYSTQEVVSRYLDTGGLGTMTSDLKLGKEVDVIFEGATENAHETTLTVTDPTADRTITLPNETGTVITSASTNVIDSDHYVDGSIDNVHLADDAVDSDEIAAGAIDLAHMSANSVDSDQYVDGSIDRVHLAADIIDGTKIENDAINSEHYAAGSIDLEHMSANSVDSDQYVDGSIDSAHIANDQVDSQHYATGSIDLEHMSANSVDSDQYVDGSIDTVHIADSQITTAKIADLNVTTAKLAADAVTAAKIGDNELDSEHYAAGSIDTEHIADLNITTDLIANLAVTDGKLADNAVTIAKVGCEQTTITDSDSHVPTSGAVVDYVAGQLAPIGGFEAIATEVAFMATSDQPASGVIVSISDAAGVVVNGSGTSTTGRTTDGTPATVTINNFPSSLHGETLAAGVGLMVSSTGTGNVYNYHKVLAAEGDVKQLSDDINDFNARYRVGDSDPGSANDEGDLFFNKQANKMKVYDGSAWGEVMSAGDYKYLFLCPAGGTGAPTINGSIATYDLRESSNSGSAASVNTAAQLIVSVNGVMQKPNTGTSAPSEGFALVDTNTIIFGANLPTGAEVFITQVGTATTLNTPADLSVTTAKIAATAVTTAKIADDAVDGAKLSNDVTIANLLSTPCGHFTGNVTPSSGEGVEIFQAATGVGQISSYDRTNSDWDALRIKASQVEVFTEGSERLRVLADGKVGIGTTTPASMFHVNGDTSYTTGRMYIGGAPSNLDGSENNSYAFARIKGNTYGGTSDGRLTLSTGLKAYQMSDGTGIGAMYFADDTGGDWAAIRCWADGQGGGSAGSPNDANDYPGRLTFETTPDGSGDPVERMRIASTGKLQVYKGTSTTGKTSGSEAFTVGNGAGNHRFAVYPDGSTVIGGTGDIGDYNILLNSTGAATFAGDCTWGSFNSGSASGFGANIDVAANAATVSAQCQSTASAYTLLWAGYHGATRTSYISSAGVGQFSAHLQVDRTGASDDALKIYQSGTLKASILGGGDATFVSVTESSDIALKTDIKPITNVLDKVQQITGYKYKFKDTGRDSMGVTAQDVEKVFPELVHGEEGNKSLHYSGLIGALIESVKELSNKVAALEAA